jgi:hypothetical protein
MSSLGRRALDALFPGGSAWKPKEGGDFDLFLDGTGDSIESSRGYLDNLSEIRRPETTPILSDLEREYGETIDLNISEDTRRMRLTAKKYSKLRNGSVDHLQAALDAAGFNLLVHENSPAVDPAIFLDQAFQMVAGGPAAFAGNQDAFAGRIGGELVVNGDLVIQTPAYTMQSGGTFAYAGNGNAVAGRYDVFNQDFFQYDIPTDPNDWPLVFFVGGPATRDGTGTLTEIQAGEVPTERKRELKKTILQIKPEHSWAGLIITYT